MDQFRITVQIEQVDPKGRVLCTYGPSPIALFESGDADHIIDEFARIKSALEYHGCKLIPLEDT